MEDIPAICSATGFCVLALISICGYIVQLFVQERSCLRHFSTALGGATGQLSASAGACVSAHHVQ